MKTLQNFLTLKKLSIAVAFLIVLALGMQVALPLKVDGHSMDTTLKNNQHMLVNKMQYKFDTPEYGDIIVVKNHIAEGNIVKRVAGLPGDVIEFKGHVLYRNGVKVAEGYVKSAVMNDVPEGKTKVPAGEVYLLGDNREVSIDSRQTGTFTFGEIVGKVVVY